MKLSILIPALDDRALLTASLPLVLTEAGLLDSEWELIVVDDTGTGALEEWLKAEFPSVQCHVRAANGGFAAATLSGAERASGEVLCILNPDVSVQPGFFAPLLERLYDRQFPEQPQAAGSFFTHHGSYIGCRAEFDGGPAKSQIPPVKRF